jgi:hypothetical protein
MSERYSLPVSSVNAGRKVERKDSPVNGTSAKTFRLMSSS